MHGVYIRALVVTFVLVSGMFILNVGVEEAFADKGGIKGGQGEPKNCEKIKDPAKNPNCDEPTSNGTCSGDDDEITFSEFTAFGNHATASPTELSSIFSSTDGGNGVIDTPEELAALNILLVAAGLDICT